MNVVTTADQIKKTKPSPYPPFQDFKTWTPGALGIDTATMAWFIFHSFEETEIAGHKMSVVKGRFTGKTNGAGFGTYMVASKDFERLRPLPGALALEALQALQEDLVKPARFTKSGRDILTYAQVLQAEAATRIPANVIEALRKVMAYRRKQTGGFSLEYHTLYEDLTWTIAHWSEAAGGGSAVSVHEQLDTLLAPLVVPDQKAAAPNDEEDEDTTEDSADGDHEETKTRAAKPQAAATTPANPAAPAFIPPADVWSSAPRGGDGPAQDQHVTWALRLVNAPDVARIYEARDHLNATELMLYAVHFVPAQHRPSRSAIADALFLDSNEVQKIERNALNVMRGLEVERERIARDAREAEKKAEADAAAAAAAERRQKFLQQRAIDIAASQAPVLRDEDFGWFRVLTYDRPLQPHVLADSGVVLTAASYTLLSYLHARAGTLVSEDDIARDLYLEQANPKRSISMAVTILNKAAYNHFTALEVTPRKPVMHLAGEGIRLLQPGETWAVPQKNPQKRRAPSVLATHDLDGFTLQQRSGSFNNSWSLTKGDQAAPLSDTAVQLILHLADPAQRGQWHKRTDIMAALDISNQARLTKAITKATEAFNAVFGAEDGTKYFAHMSHVGAALAKPGETLPEQPANPGMHLGKRALDFSETHDLGHFKLSRIADAKQKPFVLHADDKSVKISDLAGRFLLHIAEPGNRGRRLQRADIIAAVKTGSDNLQQVDGYAFRELAKAIPFVLGEEAAAKIWDYTPYKGLMLAPADCTLDDVPEFDPLPFIVKKTRGIQKPIGKKQVAVPAFAYEILNLLSADPDRIFERKELLRAHYGSERLPASADIYLSTAISALRKAIDTVQAKHGVERMDLIESRKGVGISYCPNGYNTVPTKETVYSEAHERADFVLRKIEGAKQKPWQLVYKDGVYALSDMAGKILRHATDGDVRGTWVGHAALMEATDITSSSALNYAIRDLKGTLESLNDQNDGTTLRFHTASRLGIVFAKPGEELPARPVMAKEPKQPRARKAATSATAPVYPALYYHPAHGLRTTQADGYKPVNVEKYVQLLRQAIVDTNIAVTNGTFDPKAPAHAEDTVLARRSPTKVIAAITAYYRRPSSKLDIQAKRTAIMDGLAQDMALIFDFVDAKTAKDYLMFVAGRDKKIAEPFLWPFENPALFKESMTRIEAWQSRLAEKKAPAQPAAKAAPTAADLRDARVKKKASQAQDSIPQNVIEHEGLNRDPSKVVRRIFNLAAKKLSAQEFIVLSRMFMRESRHRLSANAIAAELGTDAASIVQVAHDGYRHLRHAVQQFGEVNRSNRDDGREMLATMNGWRLPALIRN